MTDELTTDLATISQLRVISRSSTSQFTGAHRPPLQRLQKCLTLMQWLKYRSGAPATKYRISAQLIDARADPHLWAKSFERDSRDVLALESELPPLRPASILNVQLTPLEQARLTSVPSVNPEAYDRDGRVAIFSIRAERRKFKEGDHSI